MRNIYSLLFVILLGSTTIFSQTNLQSKNDQALELLHQAKFKEAQALLDEVLSKSDANSVEYANAKYISGEEKMMLGNYSEALKDFNDAKEVNQKANRQALLAQNLSDIGITYWKLGNQISSLEYLELSASIRQKLGLDKALGDSYNNIGLIYSEIDVDKSIEYYTLANKQYAKSLGADHPNYLITENNIAIAKRNKGLTLEAINSFKTTSKKWSDLYGENSPKLAFINANLGQCYIDLKDFELAISSFKKAIEIYQSNYGNTHPEIASTYNLLANAEASNEDYKNAQKTIEKAIKANTKSNPNDHFDKQLLIASLEEKAEIYINTYKNKTLAPRDLKTALTTLDSCSNYIEEQRRLLITKKDKIALGAVASNVYENAIECILILKDEFLADKELYHQALFNYIEKSKGAVLLESMQEAQAKEFANIPTDLLKQEKILVATINALTNQLIQPKKETESSLRQQLNGTQQEYNLFISQLEKDYPKYYELKYNTQTSSLGDVQKHLNPNQMIMDYFISDKSNLIVVMKITCTKVKTEMVKKEKNFSKWLIAYENSISFSNLPIFKTISHRLYNNLGFGKTSSNITEYVIIPDACLSSIPFEALVTEQPEASDRFQDLKYLIQEKNISYHFSTSLWINSEKTEVSNKNITIFAPVEFRKDFDFPDLPGSLTEVTILDDLFHKNGYTSNDFVKQEASETNLHQHLSGSIFHLPTHGTVNTEQPELSSIFLSKDSENDGILYSGEIYSLSLDYDLVTLSACETGLGKISKGEGVIGLSRALLYAGANNIVVSFWKVNDNSTSDFMVDFYTDYLSKKKSFHSSLQVAKTKMIKSEKYASPYYWAPFVLIGR